MDNKLREELAAYAHEAWSAYERNQWPWINTNCDGLIIVIVSVRKVANLL